MGQQRDMPNTHSTIFRCDTTLYDLCPGRWAAGQGLPPTCQPDYGPSSIDMRLGVAAIGASPWVTNLNVPLATADLAAARRIARAVSARGGGLPHVEAMALPHTQGMALTQSAVLGTVALCWASIGTRAKYTKTLHAHGCKVPECVMLDM